MSLYDELLATEDGPALLASSRLRERALELIDDAMARQGANQAELARRIGRRRNAVNQTLHGDGNLQLSTLAQYLAALNCEVDLELYPLGELRKAEMEGRAPINVDQVPPRRVQPVAITRRPAARWNAHPVDAPWHVSEQAHG